MKPTIIVLSGPVCAGKSTLAAKLESQFGALRVKTKDIIYSHRPRLANTRVALQKAGDALDRETKGAWVATGIISNLNVLSEDERSLIVVDSVRIYEQVDEIRRIFGPRTLHLHLTADLKALARRYAKKLKDKGDLASYDEVRRNRTEQNIEDLAAPADVVIQTDRCTTEDVFARIIARLGHRPTIAPALVDVLVGGQYGSEGKGNIAAYLAPEYDVLVRVGGPNAGHKVFRQDGEPYNFRHLPSGTPRNNHAKIVIGAGAVIRLPVLLEEISKIELSYDRIIVDPQAMIIEDDDIVWEEQNLRDKIGSTAQGVGRASARKILDRYVGSSVRLARDIPELKHMIKDSVLYIEEAISRSKRIFLEGTQGTSLSIHHGHYPHVTSRITTAAGCVAEAGISLRHVRRIIMVCRSYPIRVGDTAAGATSGYMSKPIGLNEVAKRSGISLAEIKKIEVGSVSNRQRRIAEFDWAQLRRATALNGPTDIALTFADYLNKENRLAFRYERLTQDTLRFIEEVEKVTGVPVSLISTQFEMRNIIDRRAW